MCGDCEIQLCTSALQGCGSISLISIFSEVIVEEAGVRKRAAGSAEQLDGEIDSSQEAARGPTLPLFRHSAYRISMYAPSPQGLR